MLSRLKKAGSALVLAAAAALTGAATAEAAAAPEAAAALPACTSYSNLSVSFHPGWYTHVPTLGANTYNYNCEVVRGHRGLPVLVLQESLNVCFGQSLVLDSDFGGNTERAMRIAQTALNRWYNAELNVDGRFGPNTSYWFTFQAYDHNNGGRHTGYCFR
jgi:hypothetical protein